MKRFRFPHAPLAVGAALLALYLFPQPGSAQPLAAGKTLFLGNAIDIVFHPDYASYWNQVTPGNAGKWGSVEGLRGSYNFTQLDAIYNYALNHSFRYKHHTLIWGAQQPGWIETLDSASQRAAVAKWIDTVGHRYVSASFVDVVNEPFHQPPVYARALGGNGATGWDWVVTAFQMARTSFSRGAKLLLNDYNILQDNTVTTNYLALIDTLRARNLIDGIGIQGHYFELQYYPASTLKANLDRLTATGLPVYISEFDVDEADDNVQLAKYQTYFPVFWEEPGVAGITLWGYVQNDVWKVNAFLVRADGSERPALKWLRHYVACPVKPQLASPNGTTAEPRNPLLVWHPSVSAKSYRVQLSAARSFSPLLVDSTVADTVLRLNPLDPNTRFYWQVSAANDSGSSSFSAMANFLTGDFVTGLRETSAPPARFDLAQNYPNPFNPVTTIRFALPERIHATLVVYNALGQVVAPLVNDVMDAGLHTVRFDAGALASGIYFCRLTAGTATAVRAMAVVK